MLTFLLQLHPLFSFFCQKTLQLFQPGTIDLWSQVSHIHVFLNNQSWSLFTKNDEQVGEDGAELGEDDYEDKEEDEEEEEEEDDDEEEDDEEEEEEEDN